MTQRWVGLWPQSGVAFLGPSDNTASWRSVIGRSYDACSIGDSHWVCIRIRIRQPILILSSGSGSGLRSFTTHRIYGIRDSQIIWSVDHGRLPTELVQLSSFSEALLLWVWQGYCRLMDLMIQKIDSTFRIAVLHLTRINYWTEIFITRKLALSQAHYCQLPALVAQLSLDFAITAC